MSEDESRAQRLSADWDADERQWLTDFLAAVRKAHGHAVADIIVYGSKARGNWHRASSIDVLVLVRDRYKQTGATIEELGNRLARDTGGLPMITSCTESQWKSRAHTGDALYRTIRLEGVSVLRA